MQKFCSKSKDITIVGGGAVGMIAAIALASLKKYKIMLINKSNRSLISEKEKSIVLSYSSTCVLKTLGIWESINDKITYITHIHISEKNTYGHAILDAQGEDLPFLGVTIKLKDLLKGCEKKINEHSNIEYYENIAVNKIKKRSSGLYSLEIENKKEIINSQIIIAADGTNSKIRNQLQIKTLYSDYNQSAIVIDVTLNRNHNNWAYERFMSSEGIMAMIPLSSNKVTCIWCVDTINRPDTKNKTLLIGLIQKLFGYRLGKFVNISDPFIFPLRFIVPEKLFVDNILLFGNSAHSLHPIAAQGLNLSIRDIGIFYDLISAHDILSPIVVNNIFRNYYKLRKNDHWITTSIVNEVVKIFRKNFFLASKIRGLGLFLLNNEQGSKKLFSQLMMGKLAYGHTLIRDPII